MASPSSTVCIHKFTNDIHFITLNAFLLKVSPLLEYLSRDFEIHVYVSGFVTYVSSKAYVAYRIHAMQNINTSVHRCNILVECDS